MRIRRGVSTLVMFALLASVGLGIVFLYLARQGKPASTIALGCLSDTGRAQFVSGLASTQTVDQVAEEHRVNEVAKTKFLCEVIGEDIDEIVFLEKEIAKLEVAMPAQRGHARHIVLNTNRLDLGDVQASLNRIRDELQKHIKSLEEPLRRLSDDFGSSGGTNPVPEDPARKLADPQH